MSHHYESVPSSQEDFDFFGDCGIGLDFNNFPLLGHDNFHERTPQFPISSGLMDPGGIVPDSSALKPGLLFSNSQDDYSAPPTGTSFRMDYQLPPEGSTASENPSISAKLTTVKRVRREIDDTFQYDTVAPENKWQESVTVFSVNGRKKVVPKRRHAFAPSRRAEVALTRLIGACIQCKIHRGPCDFGLPCGHCIRRAGTLALGEAICTRQSLIAIRFDSVGGFFLSPGSAKLMISPDLFRVAYWKERVDALGIHSAMRSSHIIYIGYPPLNGNDFTGSFIGVPVIHFEAPGQRSTRRVIDYDYYGAEVVELPDPSVAIAPDASLSLEALILSYKRSRYSNFGRCGPFSRLQIAVQEFAELYCSNPTKLPLHDFLKRAIRMRQLFDMWRLIVSTKEQSDSNETQVASSTITMQLRSILSTEIVHLEVVMLSEIEKLVYGSGGVGRNNPLAFWVCLWILIFSYEEHLIYLRATSLDPQHDHGDISRRYYLTRHLYNTLTSIYTALYKITSPLTLDWRVEKISLILGRNRELIHRFSIIKTELFWFADYKEQVSSEDTLFKTLVMENEMRLLFKAQK